MSLANARVGRDFYGFANGVEIGPEANVAGNAMGFGETVDVDGRVGVDFRGFGARVSVSGAVEGDVEGYAGTVTVQPTARIGGNVTGHVDTAGDLSVAPGAVVGGTVNEQLVEREQRRNEYSTFGYYFGQVIRLAGAFVTGLLLLWLFPVLRETSLPSALAVLKSAGIGLAAAVTLPVAAALFCVTIVGIPLGVLTFLVGAIGLYFSKAVIAQIIGRGVLRNRATPPHFAATLIVGLVIVIVSINLPWIGWLANLVLTVVGFGVIVSLILARVNRGSSGVHAPAAGRPPPGRRLCRHVGPWATITVALHGRSPSRGKTMLRSIATVFALAAALPAASESLNHTTGSDGLLARRQARRSRALLRSDLARGALEPRAAEEPARFRAVGRSPASPTWRIYGPGVYNRNPEPGHELYVLDLAERKVAKVIDLSPYRSPHGVQIDAHGMVYVTAELDRKILVVDGAAGRIVATIDHEGSGHWIAVLPDGSKAYVANKDDKLFVSVLDLRTRKQVGTRADAARHARHYDFAGRQARHRDGPCAARDRRHRHFERSSARPHRIGRHDRRGVQGVLLAGREVSTDDGRLVDQHFRRRQSPCAATHVQGRRLADGYRLLGRRQDGARRESRRRHGVGRRPRNGDRHEDVQGRNGNRDADVLLAGTAQVAEILNAKRPMLASVK